MNSPGHSGARAESTVLNCHAISFQVGLAKAAERRQFQVRAEFLSSLSLLLRVCCHHSTGSYKSMYDFLSSKIYRQNTADS